MPPSQVTRLESIIATIGPLENVRRCNTAELSNVTRDSYGLRHAPVIPLVVHVLVGIALLA